MTPHPTAPPTTTEPRPSALRTFVRWEGLVWSSLAAWLFRRPLPVPPGGQPFGYAREGAPLFWGFIAVSALEIPLIDLLLPNWTLRIVFGLIGLWGLIWMCGMLAVQYRMPHVVGPEWVRIRAGWSLDVRIPWDAVDVVLSSSRLVTSSKSVQYDGDVATGTRQLVAAVASRTNITVKLRHPVTVVVDGVDQVVNGIRLWADEPAGFVDAARARLGSITGSDA